MLVGGAGQLYVEKHEIAPARCSIIDHHVVLVITDHYLTVCVCRYT